MKQYLLALGLFFIASSAQAACSAPSGSEGALRYDKPSKKLYFCDGTTWIAPGGTTTSGGVGWSGPLSKPILGADGTENVTLCSGVIGSECGGGFFAGDGNLVATPGGCSGTVDAPSCPAINSGLTDSLKLKYAFTNNLIVKRTGEDRYGYFMTEAYGDQKVGADWRHPTMHYCKNLVYGGHSDWYMPSIWELRILFYNSRELPGFFSASTNESVYTTSTSTESNSDTGITPGVYFVDGEVMNHPSRTIGYRFRCVRRN